MKQTTLMIAIVATLATTLSIRPAAAQWVGNSPTQYSVVTAGYGQYTSSAAEAYSTAVAMPSQQHSPASASSGSDIVYQKTYTWSGSGSGTYPFQVPYSNGIAQTSATLNGGSQFDYDASAGVSAYPSGGGGGPNFGVGAPQNPGTPNRNPTTGAMSGNITISGPASNGVTSILIQPYTSSHADLTYVGSPCSGTVTSDVTLTL